MEQEHHLAFGPFHLDGPQGRLWQGDQAIALRPQSLAMLRYLVAHPGRLVTKAELRQHVWAGTHVTDTVLRVSVHEIRQALGDAAAAPRYLETVGRQGYRFLPGRRPGGPAPADARPPRRPPGRRRGRRAVVPAGGPRRPPARLAQWRSRDWQDDRGGYGAGPPGPGEWGTDRAGPVRRALWRGGTVPAPLGGAGAALPRATARGRAGRVAPLCPAVAGATARGAQRGRAGAPAAPGAGGERRPDAARAGRGPRRLDRGRAAAAGARRPAVE